MAPIAGFLEATGVNGLGVEKWFGLLNCFAFDEGEEGEEDLFTPKGLESLTRKGFLASAYGLESAVDLLIPNGLESE